MPHGDRRWYFPETSKIQGQRPLVVLMGEALHDMARALLLRDYTVFRSQLLEGEEIDSILEIYRRAVENPDIDRNRVTLLGSREGADLIAKNYFRFYSVAPPSAIALLSTRAAVHDLNNIACPYLVLHGALDPFFQTTPYKRFEDAIFHHQMRYGDGSANLLLPRVGRDLGGRQLDLRVIEAVLQWIDRVIHDSQTISDWAYSNQGKKWSKIA